MKIHRTINARSNVLGEREACLAGESDLAIPEQANGLGDIIMELERPVLCIHELASYFENASSSSIDLMELFNFPTHKVAMVRM